MTIHFWKNQRNIEQRSSSIFYNSNLGYMEKVHEKTLDLGPDAGKTVIYARLVSDGHAWNIIRKEENSQWKVL